jgi:LysM repeat protein
MNLKGISVRRFALLITLVVMVMVALVPVPAMAAPAAGTVAAPAMSITYVVKPGDTLGQIARYYGTTVSAIMSANGLSSSTIFVGQRLYIPSGSGSSFCSQYYYVRHGDTLSGIARWFGVNYSALASANGISNPSLIFVGQRICIPSNSGGSSSGGYCSQYYTVVAGDNLSRIAQRCGTSVHRLSQLNGISNPSLIRIGQTLRIW